MASTTPPHEPGSGGPDPGPEERGGPGRGGYGYTQISNLDVARLPIPGNAEFLFFVVAMLVLALIALIADSFDTPQWVDVFKWLGAAYIISRGIAKASRVLEQ